MTDAPMTALVVAELDTDAHRLCDGLARVEGLRIEVVIGTDQLLPTYLEVRPDVVVIDLLTAHDELGTIVGQLGAIGFGNVAVPFIAVVDSTAAAVQATEAGVAETIQRDQIATPVLVARVGAAVARRALAIQLRRQRASLADVVLGARATAPAPAPVPEDERPPADRDARVPA